MREASKKTLPLGVFNPPRLQGLSQTLQAALIRELRENGFLSKKLRNDMSDLKFMTAGEYMKDERCCGSGTCIINAQGECWCGQKWDGEKMCHPCPAEDSRNTVGITTTQDLQKEE